MPFMRLNDNVMFVAYHDHETGNSMAKVMVENPPGTWTSHKPNKVAAILLYFLSRPPGDYISDQQLDKHVNAKFSNVPANAIQNVLTKLQKNGYLDMSGTSATQKPDPLDICKKTPQIPWKAPDFGPAEQSGKVEQLGNHIYSPGYYFFTFWR